MADEQFITTTQEVEIITETPAEVQLVETSAEETYSFSNSESSASVIETEIPAEVILEMDEADPQIIQIETAGPQGAPGEKGEKGDKGDPGDPGIVSGSADGDFLRYKIETQSWALESAANTLAEFKADTDIASAVSNSHAPGSDNQDLSGYMTKAANLSDLASAATAFGNIKQSASEAATGVVELASSAEAMTGTDTERVITPAGLTARMAAPGAIGGETPGAGNFSQVVTDLIQALTSGGLYLKDDGGNLGIFIKDGGAVGIGTDSLSSYKLYVEGTEYVNGKITAKGIANDSSITYLAGQSSNKHYIYGPYALSGPQNVAIVLIGDGSNNTTGVLICPGSWSDALLGLYVHESGNIGIGTMTDDGVKVVSIGNGTAPSSAPADMTQLWSEDLDGKAGFSRLHMMTEEGKSGPLMLRGEIRDEIDLGIQGRALTRCLHTKNSSGYALAIQQATSMAWGAHDLTIHLRIGVNIWGKGVSQYLVYARSGSSPYYGMIIYAYQAGTLRISLYRADTGISLYSGDLITSLNDQNIHSVAIVLKRETASVAGEAKFYIDGYTFGNTVSIAAATPVDITPTANLYVGGYSSTRYENILEEYAEFCFAMTDEEVLELSRFGVQPRWRWADASSIRKYTASFTSNANGWVATNATVTGNVDNVSDGTTTYQNCLSFYADATADVAHYISQNTYTLTKGCQYRVQLEYYIPSANTNVNGFYLGDLRTDYLFETVGQWTAIDVKINLRSYDVLMIWAAINGDYTFTGAGSAANDLIYFRTVFYIDQQGATLALEPSGLDSAPGVWRDSSTNKNHAMCPAADAEVIRGPREWEIRWTLTWSATHEAKYIGGINQDVFPKNGYMTEMHAMITGTVINDFIIGNGSVTDYWMTITTGMTTGFKQLTIAHNYSDGTNRKMVVDPDANFTGSIEFMFRGYYTTLGE